MNQESFRELYRSRFGHEPVQDFPELAQFINHRSIRDFTEAKVDSELMRALIACAQSAATSSHLQVWSVISVTDPFLRKEIAHLCADQQQILNAPEFLVFIADLHRLRVIADQIDGEKPALDTVEFFLMSVIDATLAAERLVVSAEFLGLGTNYIGAIRNDIAQVSKLLRVPELCTPLFGLCLGWPEPTKRADVKPRIQSSQIWFENHYNSDFSPQQFDERMAEHFRSRGQNPDVTWSMRSRKRMEISQLSGRDRLLAYFKNQGLGLL